MLYVICYSLICDNDRLDRDRQGFSPLELLLATTLGMRGDKLAEADDVDNSAQYSECGSRQTILVDKTLGCLSKRHM